MPSMLQSGPAGEPEALLIDERSAAALLGVSPRTIWTLADAGEIPFVRIGRRKLYSRETLLAWIRARELSAKSQQREAKR
ncbi:MAG TPA: helix-turn-helix domain-containing protein [Pirellulaceae bacterium]|nr:helix-turn-helix domain-containing protein [Pirellulaceae bacterium]